MNPPPRRRGAAIADWFRVPGTAGVLVFYGGILVAVIAAVVAVLVA